MAVLFRQYFTKLVKDMRNSIMKELNSGPWRNTNQIEDVINGTNLYKILTKLCYTIPCEKVHNFG